MPNDEQRETAERMADAWGRIERGAAILAARDATREAQLRAELLAPFERLLEPLRRLEAAATPGPWPQPLKNGVVLDPNAEPRVENGLVVEQRVILARLQYCSPDDAALIVATRNAVSELLRLLPAPAEGTPLQSQTEELRAEVTRLKQWVERANNALCGAEQDTEHQIDSHASTLPDYTRSLAKAIEAAVVPLQEAVYWYLFPDDRAPAPAEGRDALEHASGDTCPRCLTRGRLPTERLCRRCAEGSKA